MAIDLQALNSELTVNPIPMPYLALTAANDVANADVLNDADGTNTRTRIREAVHGSEVLNNTDDTEYGALPVTDQDRWISMCAVAVIDTGSGVAKSLEAELFGGGTATRANLAAIRFEDASRAKEIEDTLGADTVTPAQVRDARQL